MLLLTTSLPAALDNGAGLGGLIGAMILIGLGVGAVKATFYPFLGAETRADETHDRHAERPRR